MASVRVVIAVILDVECGTLRENESVPPDGGVSGLERAAYYAGRENSSCGVTWSLS